MCKCRERMKTDIACICRQTTLRAAAQKMRDRAHERRAADQPHVASEPDEEQCHNAGR
jgi:hypothetical protein